MTDRRDFLKLGGVAAAGVALASVAGAQTSRPVAADSPASHSEAMKALIPGAVDEAGSYVLPPLKYGYDALEPHIDAQTMRLHHDKHHAGYVKGLIGAEEKLAEMRASGDFAGIDYWSRKSAFHGAGHFLHCVFWDSMGSGGGGAPTGALAKCIERDFGGFEAFKAQFSAASKGVEGSGWGILAYQIAGAKLVIQQAMNHQLLTQWGLVPVLCVDVWEHAYYLHYQNQRAAYVDAWWNTVDWNRVGERFGMLEAG